MRTAARRTMLIVLLMATLAATGCQGLAQIIAPNVDTPRKRWALAHEAYQQTAATLRDLADADALSRDQLLTIQESHPQVRRALAAWDQAIERGQDPTGSRTAFYRALGRLDSILEAHDRNDERNGDRNDNPTPGSAGTQSRAGPDRSPRRGGGPDQSQILPHRRLTGRRRLRITGPTLGIG